MVSFVAILFIRTLLSLVLVFFLLQEDFQVAGEGPLEGPATTSCPETLAAVDLALLMIISSSRAVLAS
jgi:hypothetical protein